MVVSMNFSIPPSTLVSRFKGGFIMGRVIKNDYDLTYQLASFYKRLSSACDCSSPTGNYLAHISLALSEQSNAFFASLPVTHYGHLENPCTNNLPYNIDTDKLAQRIFNFIDDCRKAIVARSNAPADFEPSKYADWVLNDNWPASVYATNYNEGVIWIGKRHPYRIAQEALKQAARYDSDKLYDKALYALESYITIDTSIFEVYKHVAQCYEDNWGENDIDAPCDLSDLAKLFDPYAAKATKDSDYRYRENLITLELIMNLANLF